ncbi:MAG: type II secretion system protein [Sumerlaeia bacterium]
MKTAHTMLRLAPRQQAFTLVEALITMFIVAFIGMGVMASMMYGMYLQQSIRERNGAQRVAAETLESAKRQLFQNLERQVFQDVVIDNRGTPDEASDDVTGTVSLRFYTEDGTEVGVTGRPIPLDRSMLEVRATVAWQPSGRMSSRPQQISISTLMAP